MEATKKRAEPDGSRPLVLVVDDDPDLRMLTHIQLSDGYDVIQAADGAECLALAAEHKPDVILLDIMMPGINGSEVLTKLSDDPTTKDIPVIFLSARTGIDDKVNGLQKGAVDYITKPADPRELHARIGVAARTKFKQEEMYARGPDPLTGLADRKGFEARLAEEISRSRRSRAPFSVVLLDIDHLEDLNETLGRDAVDDLLGRVGAVLRETLRASDVVFRYGGDEFAAILPDSDVGTAYLAAERVRIAILAIVPPGLNVPLSIGVAELSGSRTAEEVVAKSEIALFRAKESGGNQTWRADDPRRHGLNPLSLSEELTEREWDILSHLAKRRTEQDIARRLGISAGTVRSHKARIRRKLHVAPEVRLSDFVKASFSQLIDRLGDISSDDKARR